MEKGLDKIGTVVPVVVFLVHETLGDVPHEMAERNVGNLPGQPSCYRLGLVAVKAHPLVDLGTDMVDGLLVGNTGHDEVDVLHDHADPFRLFLLLSVLIAGTILSCSSGAMAISTGFISGVASLFVGIGVGAAGSFASCSCSS